jgi:hypothetical protein
LSHERTVRQFMEALNHLCGFKVTLRQNKSGYFLEGPTGEIASVGTSGPNDLLSPREQEALCENLGLAVQAALGLNPPED